MDSKNKAQERAREFRVEIKLKDETVSLDVIISRLKDAAYLAAYAQGQRDLVEAAMEIAFETEIVSWVEYDKPAPGEATGGLKRQMERCVAIVNLKNLAGG